MVPSWTPERVGTTGNPELRWELTQRNMDNIATVLAGIISGEIPVGALRGSSDDTQGEEQRRFIGISIFDDDEDVTVGDGKQQWVVPAEFNGWRLYYVIVGIHDRGVSGSIVDTTDVQLRRHRAGVDADLLDTPVRIADDEDYGESTDVATDCVLRTGDLVYWDIDATQNLTAPKGMGSTIGIRHR